MSLEEWDKELALARRALTRGLVDGPRLTRLLLESRAKKVPASRLLEQGGVSAAALAELRAAPPPAAPTLPAVDPRRTLLGVRCSGVLEQVPYLTTFLGRREGDPAPVAVLLIEQQAVREGLWMDFLETVRGAQALSHPHLVKVLDTGRVGDGFVVVTEHPDKGTSLRKVLGRLGRFKLGEGLRVAREVAQALEALHAAKLAHRDVKAEHIILGGNGKALLRHAGIVFSPPESVAFAPRGTVFGSPHHLAPECLRGGPPNPQSDVYALGVTAYEMITGVRPFEGERLVDLRKQHLEDPPVKPHQQLPDVAGEVSDLLVWMLAKAPEDRPTPAKLVGVLTGLEKTLKSTGRMSQRGTGRLSELGKVSDVWRTEDAAGL